jgi:hypothetical protein
MKAPKSGREKETKNKDQSCSKQKNPKEMSHMEVREKLNAKTTTNHMKHIKGEVGPIKLQALEESSLAITACL